MVNQYIEEYLPINGKRQYMLHYPCAEKEKPVVLFVHGGPGMSLSQFSPQYQGKLADLCTAVYWDLPGAGKTLTENPDYFPTMDSLLKDLFIVISCIKIKYWKQKIVLLGHGLGNVICSLYALRHPGDVEALIGAGPLIGIMENEQAALELLKQTVTGSPDLNKLEKLSHYPQRNPKKLRKGRKILRSLQKKHGLITGTRQMLSWMSASPLCKWADYKAVFQGLRGNLPLWEFMTGHSLEMEMKPYKMPVYFLLGSQDGETPDAPARAYLQRLRAPAKDLLIIEGAGHFMMLENPDGFRDALAAILSQIPGIM